MKKTNCTKESKIRTLAIIGFICLGCYRPDSISFMQLKHLVFEITKVPSTTLFNLACEVTMIKDKHLLEKPHVNVLQSTDDLSTSMLVMFMIYLWDIRSKI